MQNDFDFVFFLVLASVVSCRQRNQLMLFDEENEIKSDNFET